ncbi:MAG TPA: PAS domain S-box protein [Candidatus Binatia bacterium]
MGDHRSAKLNGEQLSVDEVLNTSELFRRAPRAPEYAAENRALIALAQAMNEAPRTFLQKLADIALELCHADSAGISILETSEGASVFRWRAVAGRYAPNINTSVARDACPCGTVLQRGSGLLFDRPERHFVALREMNLPVLENLTVPFHSAGKPVGTLWVLSHTPERKFDAEDARLLTSLSRFASAAYDMIGTVEAAASKHTEKEFSESEQEFRAMFELSSVGQCQVDPLTGQFVRVNRKMCEMTGYSAEELTLRSISELTHPDDRDTTASLLRQLSRGEIPVISIETKLLRKDGSTFWNHLNVSLLQRPAGQAPRASAIFRNISARKETEQRLYEAEERMRLAMQAAGVFAWDVDLLTGTIKYSENMAQLFGYETLPEKYSSVAGATAVIHPDDREGVIQASLPAFEQGGAFSAECRAEAAVGGYVWIHCNGTVVRDAYGNPARFVGIVQNIEDRKRAEQALQASQERLSRAIQIETVGVIFFRTDGRVTDANDAFLRMSGYSRSDLQLGLVRWDRMTPPEWMPQSLRAVEEFKMMGRTIPYEKEYIRKDGSRWWALFAATRIAADEGVEFIIDITKSKLAEEKLRESEERFRTIADSSPVMIWVTDDAGRIEFVNRSYLDFFGTTRERAAQLEWSEIVHSDDREYLKAFSAALRERQPLHARARVKRHDNQWRWIESRGNPRLGLAGEVTGYVGSSADITELIKSQEAMREADRRKDEFLATLAHELRNPLAPIRNGLHMLRLTSYSNPATDQTYEMMERQVNQMVRLVDDLLEISRITRGQIELRKERVELAAVIQSAVEVSKPLIEDFEHQLAISLPAEPLNVVADPVRLEQIISNLLNNAAKYTDPGGQIWLTAQRQSDRATISVRDSGIGIPPDMLPRIFEMFTQVEHSTGRTQGGLGIGLTLVRSLVEMHGGNIEARSTGPGRGSEFIIQLPLLDVRSASEIAPADTWCPAQLSPRRVLVVDDNHDAADSLARLLHVVGGDARAVYSGAQALEVLETYKPAVLLVDIGMPEMDGYEFARRIRQNPDYQNLTLVALTGWGQEEDRRRSKAAGFDFHLTKPADFNALQSLLGSLETPEQSLTRH